MRLLIVDDHEVVRRGVRTLLLEKITCDVCGEAVDGQDALEKARELKPDIVVMDVSMPRLNGLEATRLIRNNHPEVEVVILSQHEAPEMARQALKAGARGYVVKSSIAKDLISAINKVSNGGYFFDPAVLDQNPSAHIDVKEILQRSAAFEKALRDSEELYRSTFELAAVGVSHVSPEGKWLRVNKKLCEIVGYSEQELLNLTFQDITHPDDLAADLALTEKMRNGTLNTYSMEKRYIRKDRSHVWINLTVSGVRDASGKLQRFISVVEDISARKSAERALRESEERLQLAQRVANVGTFEWNIKTGVNRWTPELERMYGLPPGGFAGNQSAWEELVHPEDREATVREVERALKDKEGAFEAQWRVIWRDGSIHWLLGRAWVVRGDTGAPERLIGVNVDLTERKRVEEALEESQKQLVLALESSKTAMFDWDVVQRRGMWNPQMAAIYNFHPNNEYITAEEWINLFHPEDRSRLVHEAEQVWKQGNEFTFEFRTVQRNGEIRWILSHGRIVRDGEGKALRMIGTHTDITNRKRADIALQERDSELNEAQRLAKIGSWHWTPKTDTVTWSEELYRIAGRDPNSSAVSYHDHHTLYTPESWSRLQTAVNEALKNGTGYSIEMELIRPDGTKRCVVANGEAQRDSDGAVVSLRGTVQDITDRKVIEEELRQNEECTRFSLEAANVGTWEWDVANGQVHWSSNMEAVHGQAPGSFGASFDSFLKGVFEEDREKVLQQIQLALSGKGSYHVEYRQHRADNSLGWMEATGEVVFDASRKPLRMLGVCANVTERKNAEEAIKGSESRLRAAFSQTYSFLVLLEPDGTIIDANRAALEAAGCPREQVVGRKFWEPWWSPLPDEVEVLRDAIIKTAKGEAVRDECYFCLPDGTRRLADRTISPVFDDSGKVVMLVATGLDMTERKKAVEVTSFLAAIVASSDDAIVSKTLDGIITTWNKSAERIFGYTAKEAIGQHITLIIPPDRRSEEDDILDRLRRGERIDHFQTVRRRKDGTLLEVSLTISPVRDTNGQIIGASKVARDITAQKRAEKELLESEQRFRVITDASPIMVWMSGTDKLCYYFNKGWLDFVGRTLEQESGNGWAENVHPDDFDRCLQIYVSNFDARRPFEMEYRIRHHTGQYRWILDRAVPRYAPDGTFEGYVGGCLDIHDQKEAAEKVRIADETVRLMKIQDEERRRIARELHDSAGQTLTVLGMNLARLVQRAESIAPELAKDGKEIEGIAQQLSREIRTTSYLLHPPLLDELGLVSALNWYVEGLAQRSGIAIKLEIADNVGRLPSDMELAIFRLVQECLTNIHRHSGSKTADIRLFVKSEQLHVEVTDQGKGIPPERLAEIRTGGSGVGIRGMQERLRQFDGEMNIESNGSGTSVIVTVPVTDVVRATESGPFQAAV